MQRRVEVELDGERYALPLPGEHQPLYPLPGLQSRLSRTNRIITTIMNLYDEAPDDKNAMEELSTFLSGRSGEGANCASWQYRRQPLDREFLQCPRQKPALVCRP